jgi:flagellar protein FliO/FliZ
MPAPHWRGRIVARMTMRHLAISLLLLPAPALAQSTAAPSMGSGLAQMLLGLIGVLAMLVGSLWLLKKLTAVRGPASGLMRVVGATAVGGRERVVILEVGSTWLVLGVAPGRVTALAEIPRQPGAEPAAVTPSALPPGTPDWLQNLLLR